MVSDQRASNTGPGAAEAAGAATDSAGTASDSAGAASAVRARAVGPASAPAITGFIPATFTPMRRDGSVDLDLIDPYADYLAESGVSGVFVNGTTGEGYSLTRDERLSIAERWIAHRSRLSRVVVHVGEESIEDAKSLARHAASIGADAIATMSPVFFTPTVDSLVSWCAAIAESAPNTPLYYYYIPQMTKATISVLDVLERGRTEIPTLRGVKYSHTDLMEFRLCAEAAGRRFDMLYGRDQILLAALSLGAGGMVGSTYNYAMRLFRPLLDAFRRGDLVEAGRLQHRAMRLVTLLNRHGGGVEAGKPLMRAVDLDLGPCRLPLVAPERPEADALIDEVRQIGVFG